MENFYYAQTKVIGLGLFLLASEKGLMYLSSEEEDEQQFLAAVQRMFAINTSQCEYSEQKLMPYIEQLKRFEAGNPSAQHELVYDLRGTPFQKQVWQALQSIPFAETTHYGAIAQKIGNVKAVRAVGRAIGANPVLILIPCHRVIGKNGTLTGFREGLALKQRLLNHEQRESNV